MNNTSAVRPYDLTLVGATGFTGRLVTSYLLENAPESLRLAFAGRNLERRLALPARAGVTTLEADLLNESDTDRIAAASRVVISTAGPYSRYGERLVRSCAQHGTHYLDLAGEVPWIRRMIDSFETTARASGACVVHCCGFDSIPSDLGVMIVRDELLRRGARPRVLRLVVCDSKGGFSGGTVGSLFAVLQEARRDRHIRALLRDPDGLVTHPSVNSGTSRRHGTGTFVAPPRFDRFLQQWTVPFLMAAINERVVRRTNSLAGFPLGTDPDYREVIAFGSGAGGFFTACGLATLTFLLAALLAVPPTSWILRRLFLPRAGDGPRIAVEGGGRFRLAVSGAADDGRTVTVHVQADRDPGYGATAVMIAECALQMTEQTLAERPPPAGFQTPVTAGGVELMRRLNAAGIRFEVEK